MPEMRDGFHLPLWTRILLLATFNVAILGIVFAVFLRLQLKPEFESFVMSEARERIESITRFAGADLQNTDTVQWDDVMKRYSEQYGVRILLYRNTGEQLAGVRMALPPEVDARMPKGGPQPPPRGEGRGPRPSPPGRGRPDGPGEGFRGPRRDGPPHGPRGGPSQPSDIGSPFLAVTTADPQYWVGVRMPIIEGADHESLRSVLMFVSPTFYTNRFFFDMRPWLGVGAGVLLISGLCWLPLVRNLTHSIGDITRATGRIAEGRFDVGLELHRRDELGRLGSSINTMAGRLHTLTEGRNRFLGAVAHELRSPIARMQLAAEILQRNTPAAAQKYVDDLKEDITLMTRLTDELLQFARAETTTASVKLQPTDVAEAVGAAIHREGLDEAGIRVDIAPSVSVRANPEYLIRAIANILRNAYRYAGAAGPIEVAARTEDGRVQICVADSGSGVPAGDLDKIFTPFYRIEDSRDRQSGGSGLGLAIVRSCVEACGGTVECRNRKPSGLEVIVWMATAEP